MLLEVIVLTANDARAAAAGGADRLEVVRDIQAGGLTPPLSLVRDIQAVTSLPLRVMVRENGGFTTDANELEIMRRAASAFAALGVDGLVVGFAHDGLPDLDDVAQVLEGAPAAKATFHRAFETLTSPLEALDSIARLGQVDRILTSGGEGPAAARSARLLALTRQSRERGLGITIIAGGGVDDEALAMFAATGCVGEAHVGRAAREGGQAEAPVTAALVRRLRRLVDGATG